MLFQSLLLLLLFLFFLVFNHLKGFLRVLFVISLEFSIAITALHKIQTLHNLLMSDFLYIDQWQGLKLNQLFGSSKFLILHWKFFSFTLRIEHFQLFYQCILLFRLFELVWGRFAENKGLFFLFFCLEVLFLILIKCPDLTHQGTQLSFGLFWKFAEHFSNIFLPFRQESCALLFLIWLKRIE